MSPTKIALLIAGKELRELSRDLRTVVMLVLVPALLYPLLLGGATFFTARGKTQVSHRAFAVEVDPDLPAAYRQAILRIDGAVLVRPHVAQQEVQARVFLGLDGETIVLETDQASELGQSAADRLRKKLKAVARTERDLLTLEHGLDVDQLLYRRVETIDVAPQEKRTGFLLSRILVPLLMTILMVGAFYPAVDMTSGERERSTLQTLLCAPVPPAAIAGGKLLTVTFVGLCAALANVAGLALTASIGLSALGDNAITIPWRTLPLVALVLVPFALYISAILMAAAAMTKSVREAQTTLTPVFMLLVMPVVAAILPGSEASWRAALVPVYGPAIALREIFAGTATFSVVLAAVLGALATIVFAIGAASRAFTVDALMTGKVSAPDRAPGPLLPFDGVLLVLAMAAAYFVVGAQIARLDLLLGTALLLMVVFGAVPSLVALGRSTTPAVALGLEAPKRGGLDLLGVLLMAPTIAAGGEWIARRLVDNDAAMLEQLRQMAERLGDRPGWMLVVVFAFVPAVCEEIAFRGALLRAFSRKSALVGLLASSILFALAHGALARVPITFMVGILAGYAALRVGSVVAGMAVHLAHNGGALLVAASRGDSTEMDVSVEAMKNAAVFTALPWFVYALAPLGMGLCVYAWRKRPGLEPSVPPFASVDDNAPNAPASDTSQNDTA